MKIVRFASCSCVIAVLAAHSLEVMAGEEAGAVAEAASTWTATSNVTLASQYVSRGFRQTWGKPALQGGFDLTHQSGFFVGTWISTVSDRFIEDGAVEWDLYAGYSQAIGDVTAGVTFYRYVYPGAKLAYADAKYDYSEIVPSLTWRWLNVKYWHTVSEDYFGYNDRSLLTTASTGPQHSRGSGYLDVNLTFEVIPTYSLLLHYGYQKVRNFGFADWRDIKVGVTKAFDSGWSVSLAYTRAWDKDDYFKRYTTGATDSNGRFAVSDPTAGTVILSFSRAF